MQVKIKVVRWVHAAVCCKYNRYFIDTKLLDLLDYGKLEPNDDTLWEVECSSLEGLLREPAYIFVEMVSISRQYFRK